MYSNVEKLGKFQRDQHYYKEGHASVSFNPTSDGMIIPMRQTLGQIDFSKPTKMENKEGEKKIKQKRKLQEKNKIASFILKGLLDCIKENQVGGCSL